MKISQIYLSDRRVEFTLWHIFKDFIYIFEKGISVTIVI